MPARYKIIFFLLAVLLLTSANVVPLQTPAAVVEREKPEANILAQASENPAPQRMKPLPKNSSGYSEISVSQLVQLLEEKNFLLVNVHVPYEGELPNTDLFIPFNRIGEEENLKKLPDKEAPIVLYCRSGSMSTEAAEKLTELGYKNILELDGGFNAWKKAGLELLKRD